jgi:molybdenum cofactor cytidylyltransferase
MATGARGFDAIVLAAGAGSRFGGGKLLVPWAGGVLLDGALDAAFAAPVRRVTVVTGADPRVEGAARTYAARVGQRERLSVIHASEHAEGMGASLRTGAASLTEGSEGVFVFLGDMPRVPHDVLPRLAKAVSLGAAAAAPVWEGERGHPVLFSARLLEPLKALTGDQGARAVLAGLGDRFVLVPAEDDGVLFDVDRPEALR